MSHSSLLVVENLHGGVGGKEILKGLNLKIGPGEVHALMGPNGSGKSTLSNLLAGHPQYKATSGRATLGAVDLFKLSADERAKAGLFLAFQYPVEVAGVSLFNFLKTAVIALRGKVEFKTFSQEVKAVAAELKIDPSFLTRSLNEGFSGGEKKKAEILQLLILKPKMAVLDETDSGLDIDSLKIVAEGINRFKTLKIPDPERARRAGSGLLGAPGILLITHYLRILKYIQPDFVHVLRDGQIVAEGGPDLANKLEEHGYEGVIGKA